MPGMLSGAIIVFALAASAFATPAIIGGRRLKVAATLAYDEFLNTLNWPLGAAVAMLLLVALVLIVVGSNALIERRYARGVPMRPQRPARADLPRALRRRHAGADRWWSAWSPSRPRAICRCRPTASRCAGSGRSPNYPEFVHAFWVSLWLGALSSFVALLFAVPAALAHRALSLPRAATRSRRFFLSPLMIPHVVLGIAFLRFFTAIGIGGSFAGADASRMSSSCAVCAAAGAGRGDRHGPRDRDGRGLARRRRLDRCSAA